MHNLVLFRQSRTERFWCSCRETFRRRFFQRKRDEEANDERRKSEVQSMFDTIVLRDESGDRWRDTSPKHFAYANHKA